MLHGKGKFLRVAKGTLRPVELGAVPSRTGLGLWLEVKRSGPGKGLNGLQVFRLEMTAEISSVRSASSLSWLSQISAFLCPAIDNFDPVTGQGSRCVRALWYFVLRDF